MNEENIIMSIVEDKKQSKNYCDVCNYDAKTKFNLIKHYNSTKHLNKINGVSKVHQCDNCMKIFNSRQSLHNHKYRCSNQQSTTSQQSAIPLELITLLAKQTEMIEKLSERVEQQSQPQVINNIVYDNSHNQINVQFNIDKYINETCKKALNFEDTFPSVIEPDIILSFDDKKLTNRELFSKMINNFWKEIPQQLKPIQTTDLRRNKYYFKTNNEWFKNDDPKSQEIIMNSVGKLFRLGIQSINAIDIKNDNMMTKRLQAIGSISNWNELYEEALPQILSKNQIDKEKYK